MYLQKGDMAIGNSRKKRLKTIAEEFNLYIIYAFGSQAKEVYEWTKGAVQSLTIPVSSDVDIGVKPAPSTTLSIKEKVAISMELEELFSVRNVDLLVIPEVDPFLAANIIRGERLYCKDVYKADDYDLYILRRAGDLIPLEKERISLIMESPS
jgi:predicted nucleotidyltransferase